MPIYAYRCADCGHTKDVLRKLSDPVLTTCPSCGKEAFSKQLTAAGFQLKGSGWYVTDFRGGNAGAGSKPADDAPAAAESAEGTPAPGAATPAATPAAAGSAGSAGSASSAGSDTSSASASPSGGV